MLERVLQHSNLGSQSQFLYIVRTLSISECSVDDLRRACSSEEYSFGYSFYGALYLLDWLGIVSVGDAVSLNANLDEENFSENFCKLLFEKIASERNLHEFINKDNVVYDAYEKSFVVKNNLIELRFSPLRNLLIDLGVFVQDAVIHNQFFIHKNSEKWFADIVLPYIEESRITGMSMHNLEKLQQIKRIVGENAERFVLDYEKKRMAMHPKIDNIKIISAKNVSAGYDVQSYESLDSILIDRFIEVKSYEGELSFYWSSNEIEVSKREQKSYCLYLVDRSKMEMTGYEPKIIQNPYKYIFNNEKWQKFCQSWKMQEV